MPMFISRVDNLVQLLLIVGKLDQVLDLGPLLKWVTKDG